MVVVEVELIIILDNMATHSTPPNPAFLDIIVETTFRLLLAFNISRSIN